MRIMQKDDLKKLIKDNNMFPLMTEGTSSSIRTVVDDMTIEEFVVFAKTMECKYICYKYIYYDKDRLKIEKDDIDDYGMTNKEKKEIAEKIREYNAIVEGFNYNTPYKLTMCIFVDGCCLILMIVDEWIEEHGIINDKEIAIYNMLNPEENVKNYSEFLEDQSKRSTAIKKELWEYIMNDKTFHNCTNVELRKQYVEKLKLNGYYAKQFDRYKEMDRFVEMAWKYYKNGYKDMPTELM